MSKLKAHNELMFELHRAMCRNELNKRTRDTIIALLESLTNLRNDEEVDLLLNLLSVNRK